MVDDQADIDEIRDREIEENEIENDETYNSETMSKEIAENPGMRAAAIRANPTISLEEARNAAEGKSPNAAGGPVESSAESRVPSTSDPNPSNLPSTDHPLPDDSENPDEEIAGSSRGSTDGEYKH